MLLEEIEDEARELLRKLSWRVKVAGGDVAGEHLGWGRWTWRSWAWPRSSVRTLS
jgi:hypothetical protein